MKVDELFEAVAIPARNPKLGYREKARIPVGGTKEWMKAFGATAEHLEQARRQLKQTAAYRAVKELGLKDESTERHEKNGSVMFKGEIPNMYHPQGKIRRLQLTVQANGKIDETNVTGHHRQDRFPMGAPKPHIVPGDPVSSIVKTMTKSLEQLHKNILNRIAKGKKLQAAAQATTAKR